MYICTFKSIDHRHYVPFWFRRRFILSFAGTVKMQYFLVIDEPTNDDHSDVSELRRAKLHLPK